MSHFWLAAGGTGGHISPGVAITDELHKAGDTITFFTLQRNFDYPDIVGLRNTGNAEVQIYSAPRFPKTPFQLVHFITQLISAWKTLSREFKSKPCQAILTMGGYPTFPILLFAFFKGIPFFLCEQNSRMGMVTRLFRKKATRVFHSFPGNKFLKNEVLAGNPLRNIFINKQKPKREFSKIKKILLLGGSQGAQDINELYQKMTVDEAFSDMEITISCGGKSFEEVKKSARKQDRVFDFIYDMPDEMLNTDMIISRAGSGLVYEIIWSGTPAIFMPYPHATDDHQRGNAISLVKSEMAFMIDIRPFIPVAALEEIKSIIHDRKAIENVYKNISEKNPLPLDAHLIIPEKVKEALQS